MGSIRGRKLAPHLYRAVDLGAPGANPRNRAEGGGEQGEGGGRHRGPGVPNGGGIGGQGGPRVGGGIGGQWGGGGVGGQGAPRVGGGIGGQGEGSWHLMFTARLIWMLQETL